METNPGAIPAGDPFDSVAPYSPEILTIAGRNYEIGARIGIGAYGFVFAARDIESHENAAIKLSLQEVEGSKYLSGAHLSRHEKISSSEHVLFASYFNEVRSTISQRGLLGQRLNFVPLAADELILSDSYVLHPELKGRKLKFSVFVMPVAALTLYDIVGRGNDKVKSRSPEEQANQKMKLARSVYHSILEDLDLLAQLGFIHIDLKPLNIGYDRKTKRFSILDWEGLRRRQAKAGEVIPRNAYTPEYSSYEARNGRHSVASQAYSLALTLLHLIDDNLVAKLKVKKDATQTHLYPELVDEALRPYIEAAGRDLTPSQTDQFSEIFEFIKAATTTKEGRRREKLLALDLPSQLRTALSEEQNQDEAKHARPALVEQTNIGKNRWIKEKVAATLHAAADRAKQFFGPRAKDASSLQLCLKLFD